MSDDPQAPPETGGGIKPFAQLLREIGVGGLHDEASREFNKLVKACVDTGKKGAMTLKLTVTPNKDEVTMLVAGEVKAAIPRPVAKPGMFFPDADGNLQRSDPRQLELGNLREVAPQGGDLRDIKEAGK